MKISKDELIEIVNCHSDPVYFLKKFYKIKDPATGQPISLDIGEKEEALINSLHENNRLIVNSKDRGVGKTVLITAYMVWYALFNQNRTAAIITPCMSLMKDAMAQIKYAYEHLPRVMQMEDTLINAQSARFGNDSRIMCGVASASRLHGITISKLFIDEYDGIRPIIRDSLLTTFMSKYQPDGHSSIVITSCYDDLPQFTTLETSISSKMVLRCD